MRSVFARQGFPDRLISDNGSQFVSKEFTDFLSQCGVKAVHSSLYNPKGNSTIERLHGTIKSKLKRMRCDRAISLQTALDNILFNIRSSPNDVTGKSPFFRLYGREMSTRLSKIAVSQTQVVCRPRDVSKEYEKKWSITKNYEPGQRVLVRKQEKQPYKHEGVVVRKVGQYTYEININNQLCRYNQSHMKLKVGQDRTRFQKSAKVARTVLCVPHMKLKVGQDRTRLDNLADEAYDEACDRFILESKYAPQPTTGEPRRSTRTKIQTRRYIDEQ